MEGKMKSKMLLTTIGAACFSVLLVGCYGDKEEANSPYSATPETEMSGSMMDDVKESAGSVADSAKDMAGDAKDATVDAVDKVKDMTAEAVKSGEAAVSSMKDKMTGSDAADIDAESEADKMKDDLGSHMNKIP
jgi:hypothetical protein